MNDHGLSQELLRAAAVGFWVLVAVGVGLALWLPRQWWGKLLALGFVGVLIALPIQQSTEGAQERQVAVDAHKARQAQAKALFEERCKTAGEKIHRTAENVEGVLLMKIRPEKINYGDQFALDDPYGRDFGGDGYIESFVRGSYQATHTRTGTGPDPLPRLGYLYVEAVDTKDGRRYRYTGRIDEPWKSDDSYSKTFKRFVLDKVLAPGRPPRYGVTYDDISTREDREHWIAGSSLRVIDLKTNEVMAERIGYMWDPGLGDRSGGRSPWLDAADYACPSFSRNPLRTLPPGLGARAQPYQALDFVEKIVTPKLEDES